MIYKKKSDRISNLFILWFTLCCGVPLTMAAENQEPQPATGTNINQQQENPAIPFETEGSFFLGYRWLSNEDSLKAAEFIYPHSSVTFGLDLLSCPLPYRYHANAEFLSNYDFYTDAGFAYKDLVLFRDILVGAHHNLDHFNYQYSGDPPTIVYNDRNTEDKYYIDFVSNLMSLRLKAPDFPFHTFLNHRHIERNGTIQQRFLLGDRSNVNLVSESRDINWKSNALKLGANSHMGPLEIEYAYDQAKFDPGHNNILHDSYPASGSRPADTYPHNVVPETESSAHSIKVHSSYTGGVVAAATLGNLYQKNNYSGTDSTTWKGGVDFSWIPDPIVGLFFKYRHRDVEMDNPDTVTLTGLTTTTNYSVRQSISYDKDIFSLSGRYKPLNILSLFATYEFSHLERKDISEWVALPGQTTVHSINLTAHAKPFYKLKVKAIYDYKHYDRPSYNNNPDNSNQLRLTTTYTPIPWINAYLEYILTVTERDSLYYINSSPSALLTTGERDGRRDQFLASLSTAFSAEATLTASWFYQRWELKQDLAYGQWIGDSSGDSALPYRDFGVPYTDESNSFSLLLHYLPREDISFVADVTHTLTEGKSDYADVVGGAPFSLSSFSALKATETIFSFEVTKRLPNDWELGLRSYLDIYDDKAYDFLDGKVFTTTFNIKRYF